MERQYAVVIWMDDDYVFVDHVGSEESCYEWYDEHWMRTGNENAISGDSIKPVIDNDVFLTTENEMGEDVSIQMEVSCDR